MKRTGPSRSQVAAVPTGRRSGKESIVHHAFTLVELLLVIVIIAILAALILPALSRAKARALGIACMNNMRQLTLAWLQYDYDNSDHIPYASGVAGSPIDPFVWVTGLIDTDTSNPSNWDPSVDIMKSPLWPYCGKSTGIWRCPADRSTIVPAFGPLAGQTVPRVRSMSIMVWQGGWGGALNTGYPGVTTPPWKLYLKLTDMFAPGPTSTLLFWDERSDAINWGNFYIDMTGYPNTPGAAQFNWIGRAVTTTAQADSPLAMATPKSIAGLTPGPPRRSPMSNPDPIPRLTIRTSSGSKIAPRGGSELLNVPATETRFSSEA